MIIFNRLSFLSGTCDYKKDLNFDAWTYSYCRYASQPPAFFPPEFQAAATAIIIIIIIIETHHNRCSN